jgi:hypothetical protein
VPANEPRHRDEEVLREELRAPDDDEDERDPEAERAEGVSGLLAEARGERRGDRRKRDDAEDDVEARYERGRREFQPPAIQSAPALLAGALEDLVGLGRGGDLLGDPTAVPARQRRYPGASSSCAIMRR